jgi:hypothetical protein
MILEFKIKKKKTGGNPSKKFKSWGAGCAA